ncbi:MAG: TOMM system kinase/cyclase fusion protein [Deltaproteobacteria bacterium]|nr:TOMM system kinase/cyclase fusion protein [Deltaproteobacteria bacterium]
MTSPLVTPVAFAPGAVFQGRYEIVAEAGSGTFGRVYRARQLSTGQQVALKILRVDAEEDAADLENSRQRFLREREICAGFAHPNIVRLIDSGALEDGRLYAVFEYVAGTTLRQLLDAEGKLEPPEALHLMVQVLDALACAHARGVVHRDLKPENIMVTHSGLRRNATVLDFGLGGFTTHGAASDRLTASRELLGTPAYAAPEQLRGETVSTWSDLYSWGLILLECLTGEVAMTGRTAHETIVKQLGSEPVPIPAWLREQRLGRLLIAITAKDPAAREISEQALLRALESIQRDAGAIAAGEQRRVPAAEGERRQLTIVACGTTVHRADGSAVDLEDLDWAMQLQRGLYEDAARQSAVVLARGTPGETQIVFGYPKARERDARHAVRLALRIVETTRATRLGAERGCTIAVHVGVHSDLGIIRVPPTGDGEPRVEVVGAPAEVASRLADRAGPGEILTTEETQALLGAEIECEAAGEMSAPLRVRPFRLARVLRERPSALFESATIAEETPLVGRAGELGQLLALWQRAEAGELGVVLLQGEAGIGKSRLARELRRAIPGEAWLGCRCSAEGGGSPLHPIVAWLRTLPQPLDRFLAQHGLDVAAAWPLLADLLDVPPGEGYEPPRLTPERQRELTLRTIATLVTRMAARRPLVFALEDLHWADPTTGQLITVLIEEARAAHVAPDPLRTGLVLLFTARPEYGAAWYSRDVTVLPLGRLSRLDVAAIVNARRAHDQPLPAEMMDRIVERTDGVPLFVEEIAHAIGLDDEQAIPATLRELLTARLDTLSTSAHETVQFAAAIGREVPYAVLHAVLPRDEWVLRQDMLELVDARLLFGRSVGGEEGYAFRHALVRDAAYEEMVRATRQRVHHMIASGIQARVTAIAEQRPEQLAHHWEQAGERDQAARHWHRAGDRAFRRAAYPEAATHFGRALAGLEHLPETPERTTREIETLTALGTVDLYTTGHADTRGGKHLSRARVLAETHGVELSLNIVARLFGNYVIQGNREAMLGLLPRCERLLDDPDPVARLTGIIVLALDAFWQGDHARADALFTRGLPLYAGEEYRAWALAQGWDAGIYVPLYAAWNLGVLGGTEDDAGPALAAAAASFDPQAAALVSVFAMLVAHLRRDLAAARAHAERAIGISLEQKLFGLWAFALCGHGLATALEGAAAEGLAEITQGIDVLRMANAASPVAYFLTYAAEAHLALDAVDDGLAATAGGLARCQHDLARLHEPELLRLEGELLRRRGDDAAAADRFHGALTLARSRGAHTWTLRAALSLADVLAAGGRRSEARATLDEALALFPATTTSPDVAAAREKLASPA